MFRYICNQSNLHQQDYYTFEQLCYRGNDIEVYKFLKSCFQRRQQKDEWDRSEYKLKEFKQITDQYVKINSQDCLTLLDIGCDNAELTKCYAKALNINENNIFGIDLHQHTDLGIHYQQMDLEKGIQLNYTDHFDFITLNQVLHHVQHQQQLIQQISEHLDHDGYFIIRDSMINNDFTRIIQDIQHGIYSCVVDNEITPEQYVTSYQCWYVNIQILTDYLRKAGFKYQIHFDGRNDKFQKCWIICQLYSIRCVPCTDAQPDNNDADNANTDNINVGNENNNDGDKQQQ